MPSRANGRGPAVTYGGGRPTRVIFLVSDGMSMGVPSLTEYFSRMVRGKGTHLTAMMENRSMAHGWMETHSLSGMVTDSAAASCSWGAGARILNNWVNMYPDGTKLDPILWLAKDAGYGTGLVTTATATHATPAGFASQIEHRNQQPGIAEQYVNKVDVVMGGGLPFFQAEEREDGMDLIGKYRENGYHVSYDRDDTLNAGGNEKILGLYADGHVPYTVDHINDEELLAKVPTLAEMTKVALESLDRHSPNGFIVQVEGARIDHAAHTNDAAALLWDQIAFDDAIGVALEYQREHPDTLIVVTSDHGNSGPCLVHYAPAGDESFARLAYAKSSFHPTRAKLREVANGNGVTPPGDVQDVVKELLGIELSSTEAQYVSEMTGGDIPYVLNRTQRNFHGAFNAILTNHNGIGWNSTSHTDEYVMVTASGPGKDRFQGLILNTDVFETFTWVLGIRHRNKQMTQEQAMALA